jgi:hypothetical protein
MNTLMTASGTNTFSNRKISKKHIVCTASHANVNQTNVLIMIFAVLNTKTSSKALSLASVEMMT